MTGAAIDDERALEFWRERPFFLAGLVGYSDGAMRLLAREFGSPFCVTESLSADAIVRGGKGLRKAHPDRWLEEWIDRMERSRRGPAPAEGHSPLDLALLDNRSASGADHPLAAQIIGRDPETMAQAARLLDRLPYEVIDVNLACPSKKKRGSTCQGGNLLAEPERAIAILAAVRNAVDPARVTTVKMRRAYDEGPEFERSFERIFDAAYALGYRWVTVHARTVEQRYEGQARWPFLRELVRRYPDRPILGSGDVWTALDIFRMLDETGVQAAAVARGAIGNPWIFREAAARLEGASAPVASFEETATYLRRYGVLAIELQGESVGVRRWRKMAIKLSDRASDPDRARRAFVAAKRRDELDRAITSAFAPVEIGSSVQSE